MSANPDLALECLEACFDGSSTTCRGPTCVWSMLNNLPLEKRCRLMKSAKFRAFIRKHKIAPHSVPYMYLISNPNRRDWCPKEEDRLLW